MIKLYGKFFLIAAMLCTTIGLACSSTATTSNGNVVVTGAGDSVGVPECDEYIAKLDACMSKVPDAQRTMFKTNLDTMRKAWKDAAATPQGKAGLATGCKAALDTAKQSYSYCAW